MGSGNSEKRKRMSLALGRFRNPVTTSRQTSSRSVSRTSFRSILRYRAMKSEVSVMPSRAQASPSTKLSSEKYSSGLFFAGVAESR